MPTHDPAFTDRDYAILKAIRDLEPAPVEDIAKAAGLSVEYVRRRLRALRQYATVHAARWGRHPRWRENLGGYDYNRLPKMHRALVRLLDTREGYGKGYPTLARLLRAEGFETSASAATVRRYLDSLQQRGLVHDRNAVTLAPYGRELLGEWAAQAGEVKPPRTTAATDDRVPVGTTWTHFRDADSRYLVAGKVRAQGLGKENENRILVVYGNEFGDWARPIEDFLRRFRLTVPTGA